MIVSFMRISTTEKLRTKFSPKARSKTNLTIMSEAHTLNNKYAYTLQKTENVI